MKVAAQHAGGVVERSLAASLRPPQKSFESHLKTPAPAERRGSGMSSPQGLGLSESKGQGGRFHAEIAQQSELDAAGFEASGEGAGFDLASPPEEQAEHRAFGFDELGVFGRSAAGANGADEAAATDGPTVASQLDEPAASRPDGGRLEQAHGATLRLFPMSESRSAVAQGALPLGVMESAADLTPDEMTQALSPPSLELQDDVADGAEPGVVRGRDYSPSQGPRGRTPMRLTLIETAAGLQIVAAAPGLDAGAAESFRRQAQQLISRSGAHLVGMRLNGRQLPGDHSVLLKGGLDGRQRG